MRIRNHRSSIKYKQQKKWSTLKPIFQVINIDYTTQDKDTIEMISIKELELLNQAQGDKEAGKVYISTRHRDILGR